MNDGPEPIAADIATEPPPAPVFTVNRGVTMLDATALVTGAAVASVHSRELTEQLNRLTFMGWIFLGLAFLWLSLSAAGPFVFLIRRFVSRTRGFPTGSDLMWLLLGLPWVVAALYRSGSGGDFARVRASYEVSLRFAVGTVAMLSILRVIRIWQALAPAAPSQRREPKAWTEIVGTILVVAWPLQFGLMMVVIR